MCCKINTKLIACFQQLFWNLESAPGVFSLLVEALGLHFPHPKPTRLEQGCIHLKYSPREELMVLNSSDFSTAWADVLGGRGEEMSCSWGRHHCCLFVIPRKAPCAGLQRLDADQTQRSPLSLCSRKMCRQFDKAECRLNSLHAAGLSQHQILSVLGKEQRAGLLPGWHCRHCSALDLQVLQTLGQETLHENKNRKK